MLVSRRLFGSVVALALVCNGCSQLTAGRTYTFAKVDRDTRLVDPSAVLAEQDDDNWDDQVINTLEIRLADHFFKYLQSLDRPEVIIFSRVTIRDPAASEGIVFERILQNTEDDKAYTAANQGAGNSMRNITLLPAVKYEGQDITISLRVVELDQDDNRRFGSLITSAATTAATFYPEAAAGISVAQATLSFLLANNPDDLEFTFDFGLSPNAQTVMRQLEETRLPTGASGAHDVVMQPRIGNLIVIKSELQDRLVLPTDKVALVGEGARWVLMEALKLGTLNTLNMWNEDRDYDRYARVFGHPLGVPLQGLQEPVVDAKGYVYHVDYHPFSWGNEQLKGTENGWWVENFKRGKAKSLRFRNGQLVYDDPGSDTGLSWFHDKSYLALTIDNPQRGIPVDELKNMSESVDDIIHTAQLSPEQFQTELDKLTKSLLQFATTRNAKAEANRLSEDAEHAAQAAKEIEQLQITTCNNLCDKKVATAAISQELARIRASGSLDVERRRTQECRVGLVGPDGNHFEAVGKKELSMVIRHPADLAYAVTGVSGPSGSIALEGTPPSFGPTVGGRSQLALKLANALAAGRHRVFLKSPDQPKEEDEEQTNKKKEDATNPPDPSTQPECADGKKIDCAALARPVPVPPCQASVILPFVVTTPVKDEPDNTQEGAGQQGSTPAPQE